MALLDDGPGKTEVAMPVTFSPCHRVSLGMIKPTVVTRERKRAENLLMWRTLESPYAIIIIIIIIIIIFYYLSCKWRILSEAEFNWIIETFFLWILLVSTDD